MSKQHLVNLRVGLPCVAFVLAAQLNLAVATPISSLRVMTYNIWVGGTASGQPLSRTAAVIQAAQADIVGLQEVNGNAPALASMLGFHYWASGGSTAILSRFPIVQTYNQGVKLQLSPTQQAYIFDVHLAPYPYQPYDLRDGVISTEAEAIASARATRGASVNSLLSGMSAALGSGLPVFLTGDFNEPSHLDWTSDAASAGLNFGKSVAWPTSQAVTAAGLVDAFRAVRPDEVHDRGETWTPGAPAPNITPDEVHDRIDFVYYAGANISPTDAQILGYDPNDANTDIALRPYPSDHRAVVIQFDVAGSLVFGDLNGDGQLDVADWLQLRTWQHHDLSGLPRPEAYARGDLSGDFRNDHADFVLFKEAYQAAHGAGSFAELLAIVPEPYGVAAMLNAIGFAVAFRRRLSLSTR